MLKCRSKRLAGSCLAAGLAIAPLVAVPAVQAAAGAASTAAAPTSSTTTPSDGSDFYLAPNPLPPGAPGAVIRYEPVTLSLGSGAPATQAWIVMYHSRTAQGRDDAVTGTLITPTAAWTGSGPRPVVSFAVGTQGLAQSCAPSKQLVAGTEYEASNISLALSQGWAVAITDYQGYTTGSIPTYTAGYSEGHAVLDMVRAARNIPGGGVGDKAPVALWGYSQGGGASAWATVLQPSYAPGLDLVADASGGVPADPVAVANSLNGNVGAAFLLYASIGFAQAYPQQFPFYAEANAAGLAAAKEAESQCVNQSLSTFAFGNVSTYLKGGRTLAQFEAQPSVAAVLAKNQLASAPAPKVPVFQYHGSADEIVPLAQAQALHTTWCSEGVDTTMTLFPGDHVATDYEAAPAAVSFLAAEFAGQPFVSDCLG